MQRNALTVAVAAALVTMAGSASAAFTYTAANTAVVNISGSSATNTQLKLYVQNVLCQAGNQVLLSNDSNNFAVVCTPNAGKIGALGAGKTNIAVIKDSSGGSGNGISPITGNTTISFMYPFDASGNGILSGATPTVNAVPDLGLSDEEPSLLIAAGAASGDLSKIHSDGLNVVTFGTPVTLGLRNALQTAQIAAGKLPSTCTAGNESEACMPSLTKEQIASIFTGNAVDWSEFGLSGSAGQDTAIYVARRVFSSGTQTGSRAFFLNDPCAKNVLSFVNGNDGESNSAANACAGALAGNVYEGSGSGNVETCMTHHEEAGRWAISINSTEFPAVSNDQAEAYDANGVDLGTKVNNKDFQRHIKIDGYAPTTWNVVTGHYNNWVEAALNSSSVRALNTPSAALLASMKSDFNSSSVLASLNSGFNTTALLHAAGSTDVDAGIVAPAHSMDGTSGPAFPATKSATQTAPVNYFTHNLTGTPNTCQPAMTLWATGLSM